MGEPSSGGPSLVNPAEDRLDSWKEIASYLNRDVTTVQRWRAEGDTSSPTHPRQGGGTASRAELYAWARSRNVRADRRKMKTLQTCPIFR